MTKVFNVQTEGGQGEIQDYDLHQQTAVQTVAATDYVMLQDTNGAYHKILRNSLVDALRDVLGASIGGAALGTDIQKIPALGTNDVLGFGTLANIASVLGAATKTILASDDNFNAATEKGIYHVYGYTGSTFQTGSYGLLFCLGDEYSTQIFHNYLDRKIYYRNTDQGWTAWKEVSTDIPSFYKNYANLSALRTAIGKMEFVDMGLPSGRLWASKNIGAETITDYGYYFSWGNVQGHKPNGTTFDYDFGTGNDGPYASTEGAALTGNIPLQQDAANYYLGGNCRMPTKDELAELFNSNYTKFIDATGAEVTGTNKLITLHGVTGIYLMSKVNGNRIFFPCAGIGNGPSLSYAGSYGYYWSCSRYSDVTGYSLRFIPTGINPQNDSDRFSGFSIRAVQ